MHFGKITVATCRGVWKGGSEGRRAAVRLLRWALVGLSRGSKRRTGRVRAHWEAGEGIGREVTSMTARFLIWTTGWKVVPFTKTGRKGEEVTSESPRR